MMRRGSVTIASSILRSVSAWVEDSFCSGRHWAGRPILPSRRSSRARRTASVPKRLAAACSSIRRASSRGTASAASTTSSSIARVATVRESASARIRASSAPSSVVSEASCASAASTAVEAGRRVEVVVSTIESGASAVSGGKVSGYDTRTFRAGFKHMAGHSKWANIQYRKGAQDKKRGKVFTKLIREITTAARVGGADPNSNPRLRIAMDKARAASMPRDNIERAVKRGSGELGTESFQEVRYEGYGPGGVAVMVQCLTDNRNRTVADVRHAFTRYGGNLGAEGSVGYLFNEVGMLCYPPGSDEDSVMAAALDAGAEDIVTNDDGSIDVLTDPSEYERVRDAMSQAGHSPGGAEITMR